MAPGSELPLVEGCVGWLACRLVPEPHNQQAYDLFIGEVVGAWADERVFRDGRWHFEDALMSCARSTMWLAASFW